MTRTVSVVTAVHPPAIPFLGEAYQSLAAQELPAGWDWQWVVQEDGHSGQVEPALPDDPRISFGSSRPGSPGGPAVTRTMALSRVRGSLVKALDADDRLLPGALTRDIAVLDRRPDIGWTTSKALDLLPGGSTVRWDQADPPHGRLTGADVFAYWREHDYLPPVVPSTICIRRDLLHVVGGWTALPASEDTGLLLAASAISDGYFIAETGLLYRKWAGQSTAQASHVDPAERVARMAVIEARVRALVSARDRILKA
jgi:glycosyltransferase involved in cell wall biosynthesis